MQKSPETIGIVCKCGGRMKRVKRTRADIGFIRRERKCETCGKVKITVEK